MLTQELPKRLVYAEQKMDATRVRACVVGRFKEDSNSRIIVR
jgi:hypothetical protein